MKRNEGESYTNYQERRRKEQKDLRNYLRGRTIWASRNLGTYVRSVNGKIGSAA